MLLAGGIFCGVPWGVFSTLAEAYASEICPLSLRAYLTGWINVCWVIGGFVATVVQYAAQGIPSVSIQIDKSCWKFLTEKHRNGALEFPMLLSLYGPFPSSY